jgi:hypothetical protein
MDRAEVRAAIGSKCEVFRRTPDALPSDYFPEPAIFAYYSNDDKLEAVEIARSESLRLEAFNFEGASALEITDHLTERDPNINREPGGCISRDLGLSIWTGSAPDRPPESVLVFAPGYYDRPK